MSIISESIMNDANAVIAACKSLDYQRLIDHNAEEFGKLKTILEALQIQTTSADDNLGDYAAEQLKANQSPSDEATKDTTYQDEEAKKLVREAALSRRKEIVEQLTQEDYGARMGKIYNSLSDKRVMSFRQVPHRRGLPAFDMVVAPDFTPVAGLHGVFITHNEVLSIVLPAADEDQGGWQILKRTSFINAEEMLDAVTLIAAGFDLP